MPAMKRNFRRRAEVEIGYLPPHRAMKRDRLLDDGETLLQLHHPAAICGIVLRREATQRHPQRPVVDPHMVAHLATEQLVDRHAGRFPREVPECNLDDAYSGTPGFERTALANPLHHPLDIGRILAEQRVTQVKDMRLQIGLERLHLREAADPGIGHNPHDGASAQHRAFDIGDFHIRIRPAWR